MNHYAENPHGEEYEAEGFDMAAELARLDAEAGDAPPVGGTDGAGQGGEGGVGLPSPPDDWEELP